MLLPTKNIKIRPILYTLIFIIVYLLLYLLYVIVSNGIAFQFNLTEQHLNYINQWKDIIFILLTGCFSSFALYNLLSRIYLDQQQAIKQQKISEDYRHNFELLFLKNPQPMWVFDIKTRKFLAVNEATIQQYGFTAEEFQQMTIHDIRPAEEIGKLDILLQQYPKNIRVSGTWQHQRKNGERFDVEVATYSLTFMNYSAVLVIALDITERVKMEKILREERNLLSQRIEQRTADLQYANAELAQALRIRDEFLASMSHELRTPLNAILTTEEALTEGIYGQINTKQQRSLTVIKESAQHLLSLINDILDVSKIEAGCLTLNYEKIKVSDLCNAVVRLVKQLALDKKIKLQFQKSDYNIDTMFVQGDSIRLKQILVNLLSNAIKFTPEYGEVYISVESNQDKNNIQFKVKDTGIGIAKNDFSKLFQPFVQLESQLSRHYSGTGLGLTLVQRLTELHNGSIMVESELEQGSCFTITLPWQAEMNADLLESPAEISPPPPVAKPQNVHILVVEDDVRNSEHLEAYLQLHGYKVTIATNGQEGYERAAQLQPDLILMDIQMPVMDGFTATRKIRATPKLAHIPVIAFTALAMPGDERKCLNAGADAYVTKPVHLKDLLLLIQQNPRLKHVTKTTTV